MARAGDPKVNQLEDLLLACTLRLGSTGFDLPMSEGVHASLRAMLREFPDEEVETFARIASEFVAFYVGMSWMAEREKMKRPHRTPEGQRAGLRNRARRLARAADEMVSAIFGLKAGEFDLIAHVAKDPKGHLNPDQLYLHLLNDKHPDPSDAGKIALGLIALGATAGLVADLLEGTAQDRSRPLRFLITTLHGLWLAQDWPEPVWRGDYDPSDPEQDDGDLFCDVVRFLLASPPLNEPDDSERIRALLPEPAQIEYMLRAVISPRDRT